MSLNGAAIVAVGLGAGVGACLRYLTHHFVMTRTSRDFPWATLAVNLVGSFILGFTIALAGRHAISPTVALALGAGFCGGLTTFSSFSYEWLDLRQRKRARRSWLYLGLSVAAGLAAAALGLTLGA